MGAQGWIAFDFSPQLEMAPWYWPFTSAPWGTPALEIAFLEVGLAVGAAMSTWYALRGMRHSRA